jgi:hypothetical protein
MKVKLSFNDYSFSYFRQRSEQNLFGRKNNIKTKTKYKTNKQNKNNFT